MRTTPTPAFGACWQRPPWRRIVVPPKAWQRPRLPMSGARTTREYSLPRDWLKSTTELSERRRLLPILTGTVKAFFSFHSITQRNSCLSGLLYFPPFILVHLINNEQVTKMKSRAWTGSKKASVCFSMSTGATWPSRCGRNLAIGSGSCNYSKVVPGVWETTKKRKRLGTTLEGTMQSVTSGARLSLTTRRPGTQSDLSRSAQ